MEEENAKHNIDGDMQGLKISENPFRVPTDYDIFALRDREKQKKKEEREKQLKLRAHEKTTYTSRVNARTKSMIRPAGDTDDDLSDAEDEDASEGVKEDPDFVLATTKGLDHQGEKEHLEDYISKKREMFLVQYALGVKRDEMRKLEEIAKMEEQKLEQAECYLEEDATMFDEFLKDNDKNAVDAINVAEAETKAKLEKVAEIKKYNAKMMSIKSEISKNEDTLNEYMVYKRFLDKITPQEILSQWEAKAAKQKEIAREKRKVIVAMAPHSEAVEREQKTRLNRNVKKSANMMVPKNKRSFIKSSHLSSENLLSDEENSDDEADLYFSEPVQLLDIFAELEEHNLSLIQNSQDTEEALDEMKKTSVRTREKMCKETEALKQQIAHLKGSIQKASEKGNELEMKSRMFSYGEFKAEDQEKMLVRLNKKVGEVYSNCIGDNEANISTLQMLTNIENKLEELFEMIEIMPPDMVELAEKAKEKERRMRLREEKMLEQKRHQEERIRKAIERAQAEPKKKTGRRLVFRSCPPQTRRREDVSQEKHQKEEEELKYFFT